MPNIIIIIINLFSVKKKQSTYRYI